MARVTEPNANSLVSELSGAVRHLLSRPEGIRDLQNARLLFEVGLARSAALHAQDDDLDKLREALEANRTATDGEAFQASDRLFHYALAQISHNQIFTALNMALNDWLAEQRRVSARAVASFAEVYGHADTLRALKGERLDTDNRTLLAFRRRIEDVGHARLAGLLLV